MHTRICALEPERPLAPRQEGRRHLETNRERKKSTLRRILLESRVHCLSIYYKTKAGDPALVLKRAWTEAASFCVSLRAACHVGSMAGGLYLHAVSVPRFGIFKCHYLLVSFHYVLYVHQFVECLVYVRRTVTTTRTPPFCTHCLSFSLAFESDAGYRSSH